MKSLLARIGLWLLFTVNLPRCLMHAMNPTTQNFHLSKFAITLGTSKFQLSQFWAWRRVGLELPHPITNCDLWRLYSKVSKSSELVCKWSGRWTKINVFLLKRSQRPYGQLCHNLPRMEFTFPTHTSPISSQHMSFLRACCELRAIIEGLFLIGHEARKFELRPSTIEKICPIQKSDHVYKTHMPYIDINVGSSVTSFKTIISKDFWMVTPASEKNCLQLVLRTSSRFESIILFCFSHKMAAMDFSRYPLLGQACSSSSFVR